MKKLSKSQIEKLRQQGRILKEKPAKKQPKGLPSIESSLKELNGYVKTIITKNDNIEIAMETASRISQVLSKTVMQIESIKAPTQVLEWDVTVERDKDDFIENMNLKAVV